MDLGKHGKNSSFRASSIQEEHLEITESLTSQSLAFIQGNLPWCQWHHFFRAESVRAVPCCQKKGKRTAFCTENLFATACYRTQKF